MKEQKIERLNELQKDEKREEFSGNENVGAPLVRARTPERRNIVGAGRVPAREDEKRPLDVAETLKCDISQAHFNYLRECNKKGEPHKLTASLFYIDDFQLGIKVWNHRDPPPQSSIKRIPVPGGSATLSEGVVRFKFKADQDDYFGIDVSDALEQGAKYAAKQIKKLMENT